MVEQPDLDQRQRLRELQRDAAIGLAGLGDARRVIVAQDHRRRVVGERAFDDLARVDRRAVDRAAEQLLVADQPVPRVEEQAAEHLVRQVEQPGLEVSRRVLGRRERAARLDRRAEIAAADLERGREPRDARGPQALGSCELGRRAAEQRRQAAPFAEQPRARAPRAVWPRVPVPSRIASSSPSDSACGPASSSRSRGRSDAGQRAASSASPGAELGRHRRAARDRRQQRLVPEDIRKARLASGTARRTESKLGTGDSPWQARNAPRHRECCSA